MKKFMQEKRFSVDLWTVVLMLLALTLLAPLLVHSYAGSFSRYMADDYCKAATFQENGLLRSQVLLYRDWTGRFSATFAINVANAAGPQAVGYVPFLVLLLWVAVSIPTATQVAKMLSVPNPVAVGTILALLIIVFFVGGAPSLDQILYWLTGVFTYTLPLILVTVYCGLVLSAWGNPRKGKARVGLLYAGAGVMFVAGGFSETHVAAQSGVLSLAILLLAIRNVGYLRNPRVSILYAGLAGSLAAMAVVALAPGTSVRLASQLALGVRQPDSLAVLIKILMQSTLHFVSESIKWVPVPIWFLSVAVPAVLAILFQPVRVEDTEGKWYRTLALLLVLIPLGGLVAIAFSLAPGVYVFGSLPPQRALATPFLLLAVAVASWSYVAGLVIRPPGSAAGSQMRRALSLLCLLVLAVSTLPPLRLAKQEYNRVGELKAFASAWDVRHRNILSAVGSGISALDVTPLPNRAGLLFIKPDPKMWVNRCMARYYGVKSITASPLSARQAQ